MKMLPFLLLAIGFFIIGAVSYDTNNPNAALEEGIKKLNENIERLIYITEIQNRVTNEASDAQIKNLNRIFKSLQPYAYDINGELIDD